MITDIAVSIAVVAGAVVAGVIMAWGALELAARTGSW